MKTEGFSTYDLHLRYTDDEGKKSVVQHRVWDGERFFKARLQEAKDAHAKKPRSKASVELITEEQYKKERA